MVSGPGAGARREISARGRVTTETEAVAAPDETLLSARPDRCARSAGRIERAIERAAMEPPDDDGFGGGRSSIH